MPKENKIAYLDTSSILDYLLKREDNAVVMFDILKKKNWKIITSTFAMMEIADWKKRDLFVRNKLELKWDMDNILSHKNKTDLSLLEFQKVSKWLKEQEKNLLKIDFVELKEEAWIKVREISANTNLLAKDALHFGTAYASALNNECDTLIVTDGEFIKEATDYLKKKKFKKLKIIKPSDFTTKYSN